MRLASEKSVTISEQMIKIKAILLRDGPISYLGMTRATGLGDSSLRLYLLRLRDAGVPVRIAGWESTSRAGMPRALFGIGTDPDIQHPHKVNVIDVEAIDAALDALIERDNAAKLARITPHRDPMTTMFFGQYHRGKSV